MQERKQYQTAIKDDNETERKQYQTAIKDDNETERDKYTTGKMKDAKGLIDGIGELVSQEKKADSYSQHSAQ